MIEKINLYQRSLHYSKVAMLESQPPDFIYRKVLEDFNAKLSELVDHVNALEGHGFADELAKRKKEVEMVARLTGIPTPTQTRPKGELEVIQRFVNKGETCCTISSDELLMASTDQIDMFDVLLVRQLRELDAITVGMLGDKAIQSARKRVIIGIHSSVMESWNMYMARVPYHWEQYAYVSEENEVEYFIIDKLEGQTVA